MPLVPPYIATLEPYKPGKPIEQVQREYGLTDVIKLASNENPLGPSPLALEEMKKYFDGLHYYPNGGLDLRKFLAKKFNVKVENVIVGNGSESLIANIIRTFLCDDDEVLTTEAAFIGFQVVARSRGIRYVTVPYKNWHYDLDALASKITEYTKIIYLANPNNPTGTIFTKEEFDRFYAKVPERVLIILDEAYFEFAQATPEYPDSMQYRYDNVITLRTFSKIYGLAGVRIGYGFAHETLIGNLLKVKLPFEPGTLAAAAAIGALKDEDFLKRSIAVNDEGLAYFDKALREMDLEVVPSKGNFIMVAFKTEEEVNAIFEAMLKQGVIVRPLKAFGLPTCIRISTGTMEQNRICIERLKGVLEQIAV